MNINTRNMAFVNYNGQEMQFVKYNGVIVYEAWKNLIASGVPPLTLLNCKGVDLVDYKLYGNSVQDGTPTPTTPIEVESVGDKTKNLVNIKKGTLTNCKIEYLDNGFKLTATSTKGYYDVPIELIKGNVYRVSFDSTRTGTTGGGYHSIASTGGAITGSASDLNANSYGVIASGATEKYDIQYLRFYANNGGSVGDSATFTNVQLEEGSNKTSYIPYGYKIPVKSNDTVTDIFLDEPLRKIGDYTDYIQKEIKVIDGEEVITQKVVRNIKRVYAGNNISYRHDMLNEFNGEWVAFQINVKMKDVSLGYSNRFKKNSYYTKADYIFWLQTAGTYLTFNLKKTDIGATADNTNAEILSLGKEYVANNPIYFDVIVEPTEETIELPNIPTLKGMTVLSVDTEIQPSNIEVIYKGKV